MRLGRPVTGRKHNSGFTLFEMVVVICCIVILYRVAEQRLNELPAAAERASYYAILDQLKVSVNFEMYSKMARADFNGAKSLEGTNPMELLLETPSNYRGVLVEVTDSNVDSRASWYFESSSGELVYVVGGRSIDDVFVEIGKIPVNYGQIRLKISNMYSEPEMPDGDQVETNVTGQWEAVLLEPKWTYTWARREDIPAAI